MRVNTGLIRTETNLIHSPRQYITVAKRGLSSLFFARAHGAVSSIYLLARPISFQISARALLNCSSFMSFSTLAGVASAISISSLSIAANSDGHGITPLKYLSIIAKVLFTRLPRSLTRSEFIRFKSASFEKTPSAPNGSSRIRK